MMIRVRGFHPLRPHFPARSTLLSGTIALVLLPHGCVATTMVWALPRSLATTRGIINLFSLPAGTKMFQFPAFAFRLGLNRRPSAAWVVPFGNPRVKDYLHLTGAYRSLSRPSSPPRAKASAMRPSLLSFRRSRYHIPYIIYIGCVAEPAHTFS